MLQEHLIGLVWPVGADDASREHLLLRAQIALATSLGVVLLRSSSGLEPLSSARVNELSDPLGDVLAALLQNQSVVRVHPT
ncbi:hypothetical protein [Subtercola frigoramans]|uniref:Uncharacterized protein n=1 Tax=Subtercola frigoramans TaxID=120298 RepID=A0ABS2L7N4_9MICO|nr:hypothetical protein [Subtercola frigoramans]MBM7473108.1 hypothetical protein [Subtercola frigoramans]